MTRGLLDRALEGPRLAPPGPSPVRRGLIIAVALAIGLVGVVFAATSIRGGDPMPAEVHEPVHGWTINLPDDWTATPFRWEREFGERWGSQGLFLADFDASGLRESWEGLESRWSVVPPPGKTFLSIGSAGPTRDRTTYPFRFEPIDLNDDPSTEFAVIVANGLWFELYVKYGPGEDPASRATVREIVETVRFPSLPDPPPDGSVVVVDEDPVLLALGPGDRFPEGSVTRIDLPPVGRVSDGTDLFVVRAPRGAYALPTRAHGDPDCEIRWLPEEQVLESCRGARWDRLGEPVDGRDESLGALPVGVDFDGDLLMSAAHLAPPGFAKPARLWGEG
jgi:hypothetical protein